MHIKEIQNCSHFSSDFNKNILIFTESDGSITFNFNKVPKTDCSRKHVKIYKPDTFVFTTTGSSGLNIWDSEKETVLFTYKESLIDHCYSDDLILSAFDTSGINFYDLRIRYSVNSFKKIDIVNLEWNGDHLYVLNNNQITILDFRSGNRVLHTIPNANNFCICNDKCYYLTAGNEHLLTEFKLNDSKSFESLSKPTKYTEIQSVIDRTSLVGLYKNGFSIEKSHRIENIAFQEENPIKIHLSNSNGFLFSKDKLFEISGNDLIE